MRALLAVGLAVAVAGCREPADGRSSPKGGDAVGGGNKGGAIGSEVPRTGHANPAGPGAAK